jgi:hypothetical protein
LRTTIFVFGTDGPGVVTVLTTVLTIVRTWATGTTVVTVSVGVTTGGLGGADFFVGLGGAESRPLAELGAELFATSAEADADDAFAPWLANCVANAL